MSRSRTTTAIASTILVICLAAQIVLVRMIDNAHTWATFQEQLYISSPKLLKRLSLGYDGLLADIYWTRVVQYFGGTHAKGGGDYTLLWPLLNITTQLDPQLIPAYEFGGTFLMAPPPNGAGSPERAIELVRHGIRNNPGDWHLYYDLAFIYYDLKDYRSSAQAFLEGSQLPGAHPFMKVMAAQMAEHGGDLDTARMMWTSTYQDTHDAMIRANAAAHLRAIQVDEDVTILERLLEAYRQRAGHYPENFYQMISAGLIRAIPTDPLGRPYRLDDGNVVVSDPDDLPFIEKGLPFGYKPSAVPKLRPAN
jgi:tetratricopeptide (TPR) repeat protein